MDYIEVKQGKKKQIYSSYTQIKSRVCLPLSCRLALNAFLMHTF